MPRKLLIMLTGIFLNISMLSHAQYENVWAFGNKAGIDFTTNPPQAIPTNIVANEGCAAICDINGQLLFYTDGTIVWNRDHDTMPNGANLTGLNANITASTSQGALVVPKPGSLTQYYVFSMGCWECSQLGRLSYSIVDMSLDGGLGDVVADSSGILLDELFTEHMTAVAGNNCDIWLVTLSRQNNGQFKVYNINVNGINPIPVVSFAVPSVFGYSFYEEVRGYIDVSPDRSRLALAKSNLILYDFDPTTGSITNPVILINQLVGSYGVTFSPDNTKLYVQDVKIDFNNNFALQQFDLSSGDSLMTVNSRNTINTWAATWSAEVLNGAIKRAPDGKIYCARAAAALNSMPYLGVINQPNLYGAACNFVLDGFLLHSGSKSTYGLPNSNSSIFEHYIKNGSYQLACGDTVLTALNTSGSGYMWEDGTLGATRTVGSPGIYWVKYHAIGTQCVEEYTDTFKVLEQQWEHYDSTIALESCWGDTISLSASNLSGTNYTWQDDITGPARDVSQSGVYWVTYHEPDNECKNYIDSFFIEIPEEHHMVSFQVDSVVCQDHSMQFENVSPAYFNHFDWYFGDGDSSDVQNPLHTYTFPESYEVILVGTHNGICSDTTFKKIIVDSFVHTAFQANPKSICIGQSITFLHEMNSNSINNLLWTFGEGTEFLTKDNRVQHAYDISGELPVILTAKFRACPDTMFVDTINVYPLPLVNLGNDTAICLDGNPILIGNQEANQNGYRYQWNTGATTEYIEVRHHGVYSLTITTEHDCSNTGNITVKKDCYVDLPNSFTPNADGVNDYFFPRQLLSGKVSQFRMQVLNRWGQLVFETHQTDGRGWDGRFNNKEQPGGVYIYLMEVGFENGKHEKYQGNVTLIR